MTLLAPSRLWLLVPVAVVLLAYLARQLPRLRRAEPAVRHPDVRLLASVAPKRAGWRRHLTAAALLLGLVALVGGLARPAQAREVTRDDAVVMLSIDTSESMKATDVSPDRLTAAIAAAKEFVNEAPDAYRVGLVTFTDAARTVAAPTTDRATLLAALDRLETSPSAGTAAGDGLTAALDAIDGATTNEIVTADEQPYRAVVLITDGASTIGSSLDTAAQRAADEEIPVFTVAYGTADGTVTIGGRTRAVPSDPAAMSAVADATGGTTYTAESASELNDVYARIGTQIGTETEVVELTVPLAAMAAAAVALAFVGSLVWTPRLT